MSYTIIYKKSFIKIDSRYTSDNTTKYIPLVLCGCNNVYDYTGKRSRDWQTMFPSLHMLASEKELLTETSKIPDDTECFVFGSKWIYGKDLTSFVKNGISHAMTIEEFCKSSTGLQLRMYKAQFSNDGFTHKAVDEIYTKDSATIMNWLNNHSADTIYIQFSPKEFKTRTRPTENPVVLKGRNNRFVTSYERNEKNEVNKISFGKLENAQIFTSYEEAKEVAETFRELRIVQHKNVTKNKPWKILAGSDLYVKKLSSRHLWFTYEEDEARKFANQKEAETYINEKLKPRFDRNFKAINTQTTT